jgi:hypothetical protein
VAERAFDRFSVVHAAVGSVFALSKVSAPWALGSHVAFEAGEDQLKRAFVRVWPDVAPDSMANHVGDFASFAAGYYVARELRSSPGGQLALTGLAALGAGIWSLSLMRSGRGV